MWIWTFGPLRSLILIGLLLKCCSKNIFMWFKKKNKASKEYHTKWLATWYGNPFCMCGTVRTLLFFIIFYSINVSLLFIHVFEMSKSWTSYFRRSAFKIVTITLKTSPCFFVYFIIVYKKWNWYLLKYCKTKTSWLIRCKKV